MMPIVCFTQTFPLHDVDECKLMNSGFVDDFMTYDEVVLNPDATDSSNEVSLINVGAIDPDFDRVFFSLPDNVENLEAGDVVDWSARFYSATAGSNGSGSGTFSIVLYNISEGIGKRVILGPFDKIGSAWQLVSGTGVTLTTGDPTEDNDINNAGGFDGLVILSNRNNVTPDDLYFDNIEFSKDLYKTIADDDADLISGNDWIYNNRPGDNQISDPFGGFNVDELYSQSTPSTSGNSATEAIQVDVQAGFSLLRFPLFPIDPDPVTGELSGMVRFRIYNSTCNSNYNHNVRINIRRDGDPATDYITTGANVVFIPTGIWTEASFDLSDLTIPGATSFGYNQLNIIFDQGDSGNATGTTYYLDAIQAPFFAPTTYTFDGSSWSPSNPLGNSKSTDDIIISNGTADISGELIGNNLTIFPGASLDLDPSSILKIVDDITNDGSIIFRSDASDSAQLDWLNGSITGSGNITVERYTSEYRAYRFLASSVTTSNFIFENWQEDGLSPPGFGMHITGAQGAVGVVNPSNGFDQTATGNHSMFTFDNTNSNGGTQFDDYVAIPNTNATNLEVGTAYAVLVRGDRNIDLSSNASLGITTLRATGGLHTGRFPSTIDISVPLNQDANGWSLVANPYQAKVNYASIEKIEVKSDIYIWDLNQGNVGDYVAVAGGGTIQPGQSFWVQNESGSSSPELYFTESDKETGGNNNSTVIFSGNDDVKANLTLYSADGLKRDVLQFIFDPEFNPNLDNKDFGKLFNSTENLATNFDMLLSIDRRPLPTDNTVVPLFVNQYQVNDYEFIFDPVNWNSNVKIFIKDKYTETSTEIFPFQAFAFSVDHNIPESIATDRFSLIFSNDVLGIENNLETSELKLYPNPTTNGNFLLDLQHLSGKVNIEILNVTGQKIFEAKKTIENNNPQIISENLNTGIYFVKVSQGKNSITSKLIVR